MIITFKEYKMAVKNDPSMSLRNVLILGKDLNEIEADVLIEEMKERVIEGEDPEEVLYEEGLEPDYVFDLLD